MPNTTNEVVINGEVVLSTRGNTVTEDTLVQGKTAQDKTGKEIEGNLDPVSHEELNELKEQVDALDEEVYKISDDEGEISESDYIPFNDASDGNEPKKKTLFSSIIDKLKSVFVTKSGDNIDDVDSFRENIHTLEWLGTDIPNNSDLNTYKTAGNYSVVSDASAQTISNLPLALCGKVIVFDNGNGGIEQFYLPNHSPRIFFRTWWSNAWSTWKELGEGGGDSKPHTYEMGTNIPSSADLNNYTTEGVYYIQLDATASTISNIPVERAGKLVVYTILSANYLCQMYTTYLGDVYIRRYISSLSPAWSAWEQLATTDVSVLWEQNNVIGAKNLFDATIATGSEGRGLTATYNNDGSVTIGAGTATGEFLYPSSTEYWCYEVKPSTKYIFSIGVAYTTMRLQVYYKATSDASWTHVITSANVSEITFTTPSTFYSVWIRISILEGTTLQSPLVIYPMLRLASIKDGTFEPYAGTNQNLTDSLQNKQHYLSQVSPPRIIHSNEDLNNYTASGTYQCANANIATTLSNCPVSTSFKLVVDRAYVRNTSEITQRITCQNLAGSTDWVRTRQYSATSWGAWKHVSFKNDELTVDEAVEITSGNLNTYVTYGMYYWSLSSASSISNVPATESCLMYVYKMWSSNYVRQIVLSRESNRVYMRNSSDNGSTWSDWRKIPYANEISPYNIGLGYAVATVSGSTITATISGFQLRAGVIVGLAFSSEVAVDCTINISNTGAKGVRYWADQTISAGKPIKMGLNTFMYDGTYYRLISIDRTPTVHEQSYVADTSGNINIDWGYGVNRAQIKLNLASNKLLWNYRKNSSWRGDKGIIDVTGGQTMEGWLGLKTNGGRTIASGAHSLAVSDTIPNILNELRYSNGAWGSFTLGTAYTLNQTTIPTGWYNYFYIPHRVGGENWATPTSWDTDNVQYGTLLLFGMNNTNGMFRLRWANGSVTELEDIQKGNCYVGTCATAGATKDKEATVDGNFVLRKGVRIAIKFSNTNSYSSATANPITLNVNGTGAKNIYYNTTHSGAGNTGTYTSIYGVANRYITYYYDGTYWVWDNMCAEFNDNNRKSFYGTCSTAGDQQVKVVTLADTSGWELRAGTMVHVRFSNSNTFSSQTSTPVQLNVNNTGAKNIWYNTAQSGSGNTGTNTRIYGEVNRVFTYVYDGTYWCWVSCGYEADTVDPRVLGIGYGTCTTAEATTAKEVTLASYSLKTGGYVTVRFDYNVPANATMNINSRGAKAIYYRGLAIKAGIIRAGDLATFIYDGTYYRLIGIDKNSASQKGIVGRSSVSFCSNLGSNYNTSDFTCSINMEGRIIIGEIEIGTKQGSATITFPSYNSSSALVFCKIVRPSGYSLNGYYECHVDIGTVLYPAFFSESTIDSTVYWIVALRKEAKITANTNIRIQFTGVTN